MDPAALVSPPPPLRDSINVGLVSLGTALPPFRMTQKEALDFILSRFRVREGTKALYRRVFDNESVETRHFAMGDPAEVLETDHDKVLARFEKAATELSAQALRRALDGAGISPREVDFLAVTTCTGYLCPGLSAYVIEAAGLRPDVRGADLVGMGCGAAIPALERAHDFLQAHPGATAAVVCTEICSAAMFSDDAADLVISNAIFADGSAAAVLRGRPAGGDGDGAAAPRLRGFASLVVPEWRDSLRFRTDGGHLRNVLAREVPDQVGQALRRLVPPLLESRGLSPDRIGHWILHAGGEKILAAVQDALDLPPAALDASRQVLKRCGNMSSPTVLFVLQERLSARPPRPGEWGVLASFGAGFSAYAALLEF